MALIRSLPMTSDMKKLTNTWNCVTRKAYSIYQRKSLTVKRWWEGSWEDDAKVFDIDTGVAYNPAKVHHVKYTGKHHKASAVGASHPSPQRTPVLFQAGQSKAGKEFSARHAEAIFVGGGKPSDTASYVKEIRAAATAHGRDPDHIKVFPQITPILGRTMEEAQAKYDKYAANVDWRGGMAKLSQYLNVDLLSYPADEPFDTTSVGKSENAIHALVNTLKRFEGQIVTPRMLGEKMAFCGFGAMPVGTPEMVADVMKDWVDNADIDGFNVACKDPP